MADAGGLPDPVAQSGPGRPVGAQVAVDGGRAAGQGLPVAAGDDGYQAGIGPEIAGVDDVDAGPGGEGGDLGPGPLDEDAGTQEPEADGQAFVPEAGEDVEGVGDGGAGHAGEGGVHEGGARPLAEEAGDLVGVAVGVGIGGAPGD